MIKYTRKHVWLKTKIHNIRREMRYRPLTTLAVITASLVGAYQCTLPTADATTVDAPMYSVVHEFDNDVSQSTSSVFDGPLGRESASVDYSYLGAGSKAGVMMAGYFGLAATKHKPAVLPSKTTVNWAENLQRMWDKKLARRTVSGSTKKNADGIVQTYADAPRDTKSLQTFISEAEAEAVSAHASIDYPALCKAMRIKNGKCSVYKQIMGRIKGINLVAYGMTEIFPAENGRYNLISLDTLLRNAGSNYIDAIPAGGDSLLSKGFYQFTSHAIRRDDDAVGGANMVDTYAGMKLPGSVLYLNGNDNHKAAFEFAAYNIGNLVRKLDLKDARVLATACSSAQLTEVIATAHHQPAKAIGNAKRWVKAGCIKPFQSYTGDHLETYARKTSLNYKALKDFN